MGPRNRARWHRASLRACASKQQHPSWASARKAATRAKRDGWDHMEPYRCPGCGRYHVGHPAGPDADHEVEDA
jgi:hypothetical protein